MGNETCSRLDDAGSSNRDEDGAGVERPRDFVQVVGDFAEPADVRPNLAAAFALRNRRRRLAGFRVVEGRTIASVAAALEEFAVHVDHAPRSGLLVKIVDVLRAEKESVLQAAFEPGQGRVAGIGLRLSGDAAAHGIELPDEPGIAPPGVWRCDVFEAMVAPKAGRAAEGRDAAFGADAGAGEDEDAVRG